MSPRFKDRSKINDNETINMKTVIWGYKSQWIPENASNLHYYTPIKPNTCQINIFAKY